LPLPLLPACGWPVPVIRTAWSWCAREDHFSWIRMSIAFCPPGWLLLLPLRQEWLARFRLLQFQGALSIKEQPTAAISRAMGFEAWGRRRAEANFTITGNELGRCVRKPVPRWARRHSIFFGFDSHCGPWTSWHTLNFFPSLFSCLLVPLILFSNFHCLFLLVLSWNKHHMYIICCVFLCALLPKCSTLGWRCSRLPPGLILSPLWFGNSCSWFLVSFLFPYYNALFSHSIRLVLVLVFSFFFLPCAILTPHEPCLVVTPGEKTKLIRALGRFSFLWRRDAWQFAGQ